MKTFIISIKSTIVFSLIFISQLATGQCAMPTAVTVSDLTSTTATISWTASITTPGIQYRYEIRTSGAPGSGATGLAQSGDLPVSQLFANISELNTSTSYNLYLRYQCTSAPNTFSAWTAAVSFTTPSLETPVANPGIYVSNEFFTASWIPMKGVSNYRLDVSEVSDFSSFLVGYEDIIVIPNQKLVLDLLPSTNYYYRVRAQATGGIGLETSPNSNVIMVTTLAAASTFIVWTGNGWLPEIEPNIDLDVIIDADYDTSIDALNYPFFEAKSLSINSGSQFILGEFSSLMLLNEVVNNAGPDGFIIENNASFVQLDDTAVNVGKITVKRNSSALFRLDYTMWSSPTSDIAANNPQTLKEFSPGTANNRFYTYTTATDLYSIIAAPETQTFGVGIGYLIRIRNNHVPYVDATSVPAIWQGSFVGTPNNGIVSVPLSTAGNGYNLIGNPYPSVISAEAFVSNNEDNIEGTIYFWRRRNNTAGTGDTGSFYATYTSLGGTGSAEASDTSDAPNGFIQVGQGFMVKAKPAATAVVFENSIREFEQFDNQFFRNSSVVNQIEKHRVWLNLTNTAGVFSQMLVGYAEGASDGFDSRFDGEFIHDSDVALTSLIDNKDYTIQAKALPFNDQDTLPLGLKIAIAGQYSISLDNFDGLFLGNQSIFLYDTVSQTIHNLKESAYVFAAESGIHNERFQLRFTNETLGILNPNLENAIVVTTKENTIGVEAGNIAMTGITIFDMQGRKLLALSQLNTSTVTIESIKKSNQVLLIQINDNQNNLVTKKLIF